MAVAVDNLSIGPIDLKEGESVQYGVGSSTLKHDQAGKITVDSAAGQDVQVNGGTLKVARVTDGVSCGSLTFVAYPDPNISANLIFQITCNYRGGRYQGARHLDSGSDLSSAALPSGSQSPHFPIVGRSRDPEPTASKA